MHTKSSHLAAAILLLAAAATAAATLRPTHHSRPILGAIYVGEDYGLDLMLPDSKRPKIEATTTRDSYRPGELATVQFWSGAQAVTAQIWRAGTQPRRLAANDLMDGHPVVPGVRVGAVRPGRSIRLRVGHWPSGLYFVRLEGDHGKLGFAPFVLAPPGWASTGSRSSCRPSRGRRTTTATRTTTASATRGTPTATT